MLTRVRDAPAAVTRAILALGEKSSATAVLVAFTLLEATVFPAPTEALLITLSVSRPHRAWRLAVIAAAGSVFGGVLGYHIGAGAFAPTGRVSLEMFGYGGMLPRIEAAYRENMLLALLTSGYTPIPYFVYTMAAGAFSLPLGPFVVGSLLGRLLKYVPIALITWWLGPAARALLARYSGPAGVVITLLFAGVMLARFL